MKKIQILYPEPQMDALRRAAKRLDRPVSDIVREATAEWLQRHAPYVDPEAREAPPVFRAGNIRVHPDQLREAGRRDA